jgi:hypothetical protein
VMKKINAYNNMDTCLPVREGWMLFFIIIYFLKRRDKSITKVQDKQVIFSNRI